MNARMHSLLAGARAMIATAAGLTALSTPLAIAQAPAQRSGEIVISTGAGPVSPKVDEILTRIESRKVSDLNAKIIWDQKEVIAADDDAVDRRKGEIWYLAKGVAVPVFLIQFKERTSNGRKDRLDEQYLFDGERYVELKNNTVTRRQVRRPGDQGNPYRLGEGPFPVPFGQTKADIVREYDVELAQSSSKDPKDTDHLLLKPRPGSQMFGKYGELHFYVRRGGKEAGLPIKVELGKLDAATANITAWTVVEFADPKLDRDLDPKMFQIKTPRGAEEIIEDLDEDDAGPGQP